VLRAAALDCERHLRVGFAGGSAKPLLTAANRFRDAASAAFFMRVMIHYSP
jgi:hypothetical protein